nr:hypothetical protein [Pseudonocardia sp. AL041005-10]
MLAIVGLVVWLLFVAGAIYFGDWKLAAYGLIAFLILGVIGALLQPDRTGGDQ